MKYKTFKRSSTNWETFSKARKITVNTGLNYTEAQKQCRQFNQNRTKKQIKNGTFMEFTAE